MNTETKIEQDAAYRHFLDSGEAETVARCLSMAYLLQSVANSYNEEAIDIMNKYKQVRKKVKTVTNNLMQSFDAYDKVLFSFLQLDEERKQLCDSFDAFKAECDRFMKNIKREKGEAE